MKRILLIAALLITISATSQEKQKCKGITSKNQPCKSTFVDKQGYCKHHSPATVRCSAIKSNGQKCRMIPKEGQTKCYIHSK